MQLRLFQVDAFTETLFGGNPAAVVPLTEWLPDALMQNIGMENNLAETAFFLPTEGGFQLRWFTPAIEVDLCGHATLASAHVLFQHLGYHKEQIHFFTRSGELIVERAEKGYRMDFPADRLEPLPAPQPLKEGLGCEPLEVYRGREDYLVVLGSEEELRGLQPNFRTLAALGGRGVIATAPGEEVDFVSRCFFPAAGIDEDPVTGSAHTTLTPYWSERLGKDALRARQLSRRGGELLCERHGQRVHLIGSAVTYLEGSIHLPDWD